MFVLLKSTAAGIPLQIIRYTPQQTITVGSRMGWKPADKIAVTLHNFKASGAQHLSVSVGDLLYILEELESGGKKITGDY